VALESVLAGEALVAVVAWERLHSQVNALVSFQIVIAVEALRALVAFEWSIIRCRLMVWWLAQKVRHRSCVSAVESLHHPWMNAYQSKLTVRVLDV